MAINPHSRHMNLRATVLRNALAGTPDAAGSERFDYQAVAAGIPCMLESVDDNETVQQDIETGQITLYVVFAPADFAPPDIQSSDQLEISDPKHPEYGTRTVSVVGPLANLEGRGRVWQVRGVEHP